MPFLLSQLIEFCRWLGALVVLALHTTNLFVNLGDIMSASHNPAVYVWWFFTGFPFGHQGVVGFFVISGYLVGGVTIDRMLSGSRFLIDYFINRISRIYVVVIPALILTLVFDSLGRSLFNATGVYDWPVFSGHFSPWLLVASAFNLQDIAYDYYGTNGPLWSLACEFWYYITFPLLVLPLARGYSVQFRIRGFCLGLLIMMALLTPHSWFGFGSILWAMGALATRATVAPIRSRALALAIFFAVLTLIRLLVRGSMLADHPWLAETADLLSAFSFILVVLAFRDGPEIGYAFLRHNIHKTLADFSFSLYAIHMPILIFARAAASWLIGEAWVTQLAQPANYLLALVVMATIIFVAWGFSRLTEARTGAARRFLRTALNRIAPATRVAG